MNNAPLATACPTWCIGGPGHDDHDSKVCVSETHETMLTTEAPALGGAGVHAATADLHSEQDASGYVRYFLNLESGDNGVTAALTEHELRRLRDAATALLRSATNAA